MAARGSKSKKGSAANSTSKPPDPTFFLDKCLGSVVVRDGLRAAGCLVEIMTDHFEQDRPDVEWLPEVGRRGWIILSKDKNLRHNYIEIVALLRSGAPSFLLTSGDLSGTWAL